MGRMVPSRYSTSQKIVRALVVVLAIFGFLEAGLRLCGFSYRPATAQFFHREDLLVREGEPLLRFSDSTFWELRPGSSLLPRYVSPTTDEAVELGDPVNESGFRGPPIARGEGVLRVACMGDSCTFGHPVPVDLIYPSLVGEALAERFEAGATDVINGGCIGWTVYQGLRAYRDRVLPLRPEVTILYFGSWNDFTPAIGRNDLERGKIAGGGLGPHWLVEGLGEVRVYQAIRLAVSSLGLPRTPDYRKSFWQGEPLDGRRVPVEDFERLLTEFVELARQHGSRPILVVPPAPLKTRRDFPISDEYAERVRAVGTRTGTPVVDARRLLAEAQQRGEQVFADWIHPSPAGHRIIAEALLPHVPRRDLSSQTPIK